jgi:hypothetical protein
MNVREFTDGGLTSPKTFWPVSLPLMFASIIIPVAFSGLLVRIVLKVTASLYLNWIMWWPFCSPAAFLQLNVASAVMGGHPLFWTDGH